MELNQLLGYSSYGHGPEKVLVFHDWMGDADNWRPMMDYLDQDAFTYVFAELRGYGKSRHLTGAYTALEAAADAFCLVDHLGWEQFHLVGHSMTGMVVQRMMLQDWNAGAGRIKRVVAVTPVSANAYPADDPTKDFLWNVIGNVEMSEMAFSMLTGQRLLPAWGRLKTSRHLASADTEALKGYYHMWLEEDFSNDVAVSKIGIPLLVIGGHQDLPGFQENHLRETFGKWYPSVNFQFIADAGHYPMQETPAYLATLIERFLHEI